MNLKHMFGAAVRWMQEQPWQLWTNQAIAIVRTDVGRRLFTRRALLLYLLAFAPAFVITVHALVDGPRHRCNLDEDTRILAGIVQFYYLRLGIFFGCMGIFTWLFRGEVVEKTLHYLFLIPVRRQVLVIGKFLSGLVTVAVVFEASLLTSFIFMYGHLGAAGSRFVFEGPGLGHLAAYMLVTVLACIGYGSMFLALSLVFSNPIIPGILLLGFESISTVLPSVLQKLTVSFYLKHLCPVDAASDGVLALFTVVTDPVRPVFAVMGVLALAVAVLAFSCVRIRKLEVTYTTD